MNKNETMHKVIDSVSQVPGALDPRGSEPPAPPRWVRELVDVVRISGTYPLDNQVPGWVPEAWARDKGPHVFLPIEDPDSAAEFPIDEPPEGWTSIGTEILAWYSPFHYCAWDWGVHVRAHGIEVVSRVLIAAGAPRASAGELAMKFLLGHEFGHFHREMLVSAAEVTSGRPLYVAGQSAISAAHPGWSIPEEGLCNALGRSCVPSTFRAGLDSWLDAAPVGYRDYRKHISAPRGASWAQVVGDVTGAQSLVWSGVPRGPDLTSTVNVMLHLDGSGPRGLPLGYLLGPIQVTESAQFLKDLKKSGNERELQRAWARTKGRLGQGELHGGCHLKKLRGQHYSVRLSRSTRAAIERREAGEWCAVMIDQDHDALYERLGRQTP